MKIKVVFDDVSKLTWAIRVIEKFDNYGLDDMLTHHDDMPLVEFYDTRYAHTDLGQFVSRYKLDTILKFSPDQGLSGENGLCLYGGVKDWCIYRKALTNIAKWLEAKYPQYVSEIA